MYTTRFLSLLILASAVTASVLAAPQPDPVMAAAMAWESGKKVKPIVDGDGTLRFPYGSYQATVTARPLHVADVEMQSGESVQETACGDTKRWLINVIRNDPDHVIIKPTEAGLVTNLVIITNKRSYNLRLVSKEASYVPRVGWYYPQEMVRSWRNAEANETTVAKPAVAIDQLNFSYSLGGTDSEYLRPVRVFDDGVRTYIQMPESMRSREAPTVFVTGPDGDQLVNYRLSGGTTFVVDKLFDEASLVLGAGKNQQRVTITNDRAKKPWYRDWLGGSATARHVPSDNGFDNR